MNAPRSGPAGQNLSEKKERDSICAIWGFAARPGRGLDVRTIQDVALGNIERGRHAFGIAWVDAAGRLRMFKRPGSVRLHLDDLAVAEGARMLIGHGRYATVGSHHENANNHPHPSDGGWIVHNGTLTRERELTRRYRLARSTDCDSEVLGLMIERSRAATPLGRVAATVAASGDDDLAMMAIWARPMRLVVARRGKPLHAGRCRDGVYFASLADGLPGEVAEFPDGTAAEYRAAGRPTVASLRPVAGLAARP